jgi:signal peptidase I
MHRGNCRRGLGRDIVEIRNNIFYLNGIPQPRRDLLPDGSPPPLPEGCSKYANYGPILIPEGMIFCLGDNWNESYDSRFWGPLGVHALRGKVLYTYFRWSWIFEIPDAGRGH